MDTKYRLISCTPHPSGNDNYAVVVWDGKQNLVGTIPGTQITELVNTGSITGLKPLETEQQVGGQRKTAA